ncbi:LacI family DNA-binding transcriptional regulator [Clostridium ganghwense]|uniref:LacI family DNA-binding transcriptional regulator n=1 Tax=Clostridium ganghwense TaxID=312089 RepID=A0ABT4CJM0_9CLOT|nr:LacI family DNA-binding transcriptional regulator [Clostridium ganghwense]MCY6369242.1 LacI family DNA-binding transcriptional regulator [Clostridium ganghwense]
MKPTIRDVAKKANVSVATVSRVLNNQDGYSEKTKEKVLEAIKELGYKPNAIARGLANKSTQTIGVLVPDVSTMFLSKILNGIEITAHKKDYSVIICNTGILGERIIDYLNILSEKRVDGLIIVSLPMKNEYHEAISSMNVPCILVSTMSYRYQLPYVKVDDRQAAYNATQFLIERGHKKIAMISGTKDEFIAGKSRVDGYIDALRDYGLSIDESLIKYGDFSYRSGIKCMEELLEEGIEKFTAIFAASDDMAVGALSMAYQRGIKIPDELSIIGYDNTQIAEMSIPPLTTVAQPFYEMGEKAAEKLVHMIESKGKAENIIMPHYIQERSTVKEVK